MTIKATVDLISDLGTFAEIPGNVRAGVPDTQFTARINELMVGVLPGQYKLIYQGDPKTASVIAHRFNPKTPLGRVYAPAKRGGQLFVGYRAPVVESGDVKALVGRCRDAIAAAPNPIPVKAPAPAAPPEQVVLKPIGQASDESDTEYIFRLHQEGKTVPLIADAVGWDTSAVRRTILSAERAGKQVSA